MFRGCDNLLWVFVDERQYVEADDETFPISGCEEIGDGI